MSSLDGSNMAASSVPDDDNHDDDNVKAAFVAVDEDDWPTIEASLISGFVTTSSTDQHGMTLLHQAAYRARAEICGRLCERGAVVNADCHEHNYTPLHFAALSGRSRPTTDTVRTLLGAGANPALRNSVGRTAAQMAAFVGAHHTAAVISSFVPRQQLQQLSASFLQEQLVDVVHQLLSSVNIHPVRVVRVCLGADWLKDQRSDGEAVSKNKSKDQDQDERRQQNDGGNEDKKNKQEDGSKDLKKTNGEQQQYEAKNKKNEEQGHGKDKKEHFDDKKEDIKDSKQDGVKIKDDINKKHHQHHIHQQEDVKNPPPLWHHLASAGRMLELLSEKHANCRLTDDLEPSELVAVKAHYLACVLDTLRRTLLAITEDTSRNKIGQTSGNSCLQTNGKLGSKPEAGIETEDVDVDSLGNEADEDGASAPAASSLTASSPDTAVERTILPSVNASVCEQDAIIASLDVERVARVAHQLCRRWLRCDNTSQGGSGGSGGNLDAYVRQCVRSFAVRQLPLFQQLVAALAHGRRSLDALDVLTRLLSGQTMPAGAGGGSDEKEGQMCAACSQCGAVRRCGKCQLVRYCDRLCQRLHWPTHRGECGARA